MKTVLWWLNYRPLLWILLGAVSIAALASIGFQHALNKSDWGTWVGAVGTVGALIGTIWLAYGETRRRERRELLIAELHAEEILVQVVKLRASTRALSADSTGVLVTSTDPRILNWCIDHVKKLEAWQVEELIPLTAMSTNVAVNMARAAGTLKLIQAAYADGMIDPTADALELASDLRALLLKLDEYLERAEFQLKAKRKLIPYSTEVT
jgi:hypothetical protein